MNDHHMAFYSRLEDFQRCQFELTKDFLIELFSSYEEELIRLIRYG